MKFKIDENLPVEVVTVLSDHGHDAISVIDQNLAGAVDGIIANVCKTEQRVLVTLDLDFADIRTYSSRRVFGIHCPATQDANDFSNCRFDRAGHSLAGEFVAYRTIMDLGRIPRSNSTEIASVRI